MEINQNQVKHYLEKEYGKKISDVRIEKLGSGVLGTGYLIEFLRGEKKERLVIKSLMKENLGLDHYSDRAGSLLEAHDNYNKMDNHVKSRDVVAETTHGELISVGDAREFYIIMEEAQGKDLFKDFEEIKTSNILSELTRNKINILSDFLVSLHAHKKDSVSLYRRKIRDTLGSGGSLIGILDMHPDAAFDQFKKEWLAIVTLSMKFWHRSRYLHHRLCEIHADFHPGNLWFDGTTLTILDRARGRYGEPADDLTAFLVNPLLYSLTRSGKFEGAFKEVFDLFWNNYFKHTQDKEMRKIIAPYFAFRVAVVTNPLFYNDAFFGSKEKAYYCRKKLIDFSQCILQEKEFDPAKINKYFAGE